MSCNIQSKRCPVIYELKEYFGKKVKLDPCFEYDNLEEHHV